MDYTGKQSEAQRILYLWPFFFFWIDSSTLINALIEKKFITESMFL